MDDRFRAIFLCLGVFAAGVDRVDGAPPLRYEASPHGYWERPLDDASSRGWREKLAALTTQSPVKSELEQVKLVLAALDLPESSQMLVFSATSLQRIIGPHRPRALFFNDELYLGWVPGGRLEIAADDPALGPVFFIASMSGGGGRIGEPERESRCLNCHGNADTGNLPALLSASVLPDEAGGSLETFRPPATGHQVPLAQRFGGWHLTDASPEVAPLANLIGESNDGTIRRLPNAPGERFALGRYPRATSTLLPQLVHEHQVGAVNLMTAALYRARELTAPGRGELTAPEEIEIDTHATGLVRYFLFADEAALPAGGVPRDPDFASDFTANRRPDAQGRSLKDLDLKSRLFTYRCSYLLYTPLWKGLPPLIKDRVWKGFDEALRAADPSAHGTHLAEAERRAIRDIIAITCEDRPEWWR